MVFREVFPPVDGFPLFLRPRGTALVVRLAVCCFWPAIAPAVLFHPRSCLTSATSYSSAIPQEQVELQCADARLK